MVAKEKKPKFVPITEVLSPETAFIQTSNILDIAAEIAVERQDLESLINIAAVYGELGSRMMGGTMEDEDDEEEYDESAKQPLGFSPPKIIETQEVSETDERSDDAEDA